MTCVVCGNPVQEAAYANAWEKARKMFPCCSQACAARFDPDAHWMPASLPPAVTEDEERRLLGVSRNRLRDGDKPSVVIREMLVAGVSVTGLRKAIFEANVKSDAARKTARRWNVLFGIRMLLGGGFGMAESADKRDPALLQAATVDLDAWRARFFP